MTGKLSKGSGENSWLEVSHESNRGVKPSPKEIAIDDSWHLLAGQATTSLLRGATDVVDHKSTRDYIESQGNGRIKGDTSDCSKRKTAVHEAADSKGSKPTTTAYKQRGLGYGLVSFVSAALLDTLPAIRIFTSGNSAMHNGGHDESDFEKGIEVDPGNSAEDAELYGRPFTVGERDLKADLSAVGTHTEDSLPYLRGLTLRELEAKSGEDLDVELRSSARALSGSANDALALGDMKKDDISVKCGGDVWDLNTSNESEARERRRKLRESLLLERLAPSEAEHEGVGVVRVLQVGPRFHTPDQPPDT